MTLRFGSIIIHKPGPKSETDSCNASSDDAEVAEIAETATLNYSNKRNASVRRSERQKRLVNKSRSLQTRRSSRSSGTETSEVSILRAMSSDKSPPFVRSHYAEDRLQGIEVIGKRNSLRPSTHSAEENSSDGEHLGFGVLTSGPRTVNKKINGRRVVATPDVVSSLTTPFVPIFDDDSAINGLSRLLKNLNFTEKLRQQKAEQERLDIHKMPQHLKEQLKHIYVY